MAKKVVVVGAGIAGLTAGNDLTKAGYDVTVLERDDLPGGRMADRVVNGICTHTGASVLFSFNKVMLDLVKELGLTKDLYTFPDRNGGYTVNNGESEYKLKLTFDPVFLLKHPAFGVKTKAKLALLLPDMIKSGLQTDPCMMHTAAQFDDENVTDYITRKVSAEFLENYIEPYFRAPWHWEPEQISKAYLLSLLGHVVGADLLSFNQGIGHLTRTLAGVVNLKLNCHATKIQPAETSVTVAYEENGTPRIIDADFVICATPGTKVKHLVADLNASDRAFFDGVRYNRGARIYYALKPGPLEARYRWFTRKSPCKFSLFYAMPEDAIVPKGHTQPPYLQCELTPELSKRIEREGGQKKLDSYVRDEVNRLYPEIADRIVGVAEQWWDDMLTEWYTGYTKTMAGFLAKQEATHSRVYYCGDYLSQSHTGGACASGRRAASLLQTHWG
ncbi:protoporphyrinogen/coproporphyrinogen oxidase [Mesorhizobium sp. AaZ16]|uniref:protoporphyrinogen/coproporphyrinogen oxidase n=1 Tax=Mesorhizobium sp. AaZ16 TaxID=3402289 RepID=UPI00374EC8CA